jgi:hypothetical protein
MILRRVKDLSRLTAKFAEAQGALEGDGFAAGSRFPGYLLAIRHRFQKLAAIEPQAVAHVEREVAAFQSGYAHEWRICLMQAFLNPAISFEPGRICTQSEMQALVEQLTSMLDHQMRGEARAREETREGLASDEPTSDDFFSFPSAGGTAVVPAARQVDFYRLLRATSGHPLAFWQQPPDEIRPLARLAVRVLGLLLTSPSAERIFSLARLTTGDGQMAMAQETISARAMVQANWDVAAEYLADVLQEGPRSWQAAHRARKARKQAGAVPWRLNIVSGARMPE